MALPVSSSQWTFNTAVRLHGYYSPEKNTLPVKRCQDADPALVGQEQLCPSTPTFLQRHPLLLAMGKATWLCLPTNLGLTP